MTIEDLGSSVSYRDSLRFLEAPLSWVSEKHGGCLKNSFPDAVISGGEYGNNDNQHQEGDNPDQRTLFKPACLSYFEVLDAIPSLILPCPLISFDSQNKWHDDIIFYD